MSEATSPLTLRSAEPRHAGGMAGLSAQLGYPCQEADLARRLAAVIGREDHVVLVAELDGVLVGWIHGFCAFRIESPAFAEIGGLVVDQAHRGAGIGRRLVAATAEWAAAKELRQLRVRTNVVRAESQPFYLALRFRPVKQQAVFTLEL